MIIAYRRFSVKKMLSKNLYLIWTNSGQFIRLSRRLSAKEAIMKKVLLGFIIALVLVIGVGVGLLVWVLHSNDSFSQDVELQTEGVTTQELVYTAENFLPGQTREYTLIVHSAEGGDFSVSFSCESTGTGVLWQYLDIEIIYGEVSKEVAFAELFDGSVLDFDVSLEKDVPMSFTIRYKMPLGVGNEAQKGRTDFILLMTAERK